MDLQSVTDALEALMQYVKGLVASNPIVPPIVTPPTAPTITVTVIGSTLSIAVTAPATHPDGIAAYQIWLSTTSGAETYYATATTMPYVTPPLAANTYYVKAAGVTPYAVVGTLSAEVSGTISGALGPDTYPPAVPSAPTKVSGGLLVLPSVASAIPTADDSSHSGTQVVSGADHVNWYDGGVKVSTCQVPALGSGSVVQIGPYVSGSGTDNGSTITSCLCTGGDSHYGAADGGFTYSRKPTTGAVTLSAKVTAASSADYWAKPFIFEVRTDDSPDSAYVNVLVFSSTGAATVISEYRTSRGAQAQQTASVAYTLPIYLKLTYDPDTGIAVASKSPDGSSWTAINTLYIPGIGKRFYSGIAAAAGGPHTTSANYTTLSQSVDSVVRYAFTGTQLQQDTTRSIQASMVDKAGNESALSTATVWTFTGSGSPTPTNVFPRIGAYAIGTFEGIYGSGTFLEFMKHADAVVVSNQQTDFGGGSPHAGFVAAKAANPALKIGYYYWDQSFPRGDVTGNDGLPTSLDVLKPMYDNGWLGIDGGTGLPLVEEAGPPTVYVWPPYPAGPAGNVGLGNGFTSNQFVAQNWLGVASSNSNGQAPHFSLSPSYMDVYDASFYDDLQANMRSQYSPELFRGFPVGVVGSNDLEKRNDTLQWGMSDLMRTTESITGKMAWLNGQSPNDNSGHPYNPPRLSNLALGGVIERIDWLMRGNRMSSDINLLLSIYTTYNDQINGPYQISSFNHVLADGRAALINEDGTYSGQFIPAGEGSRYWFACYLVFCRQNGATIHMTPPGYGYNGGAGQNSSFCEDYQPQNFCWFDIYSVNRSTGVPYTYPNVDAGRGYLGTALQAPQMGNRQSNGTFIREFQFGYAVFNPQGSGNQTVTFANNVIVVAVGGPVAYAAGASVPVGDQRGLIAVKV